MATSDVIDFVPRLRDIGRNDSDHPGANPMSPLPIAAVRILVSSPVTTACLAWSAKLIAKILARQLQVPEALVHDAGRYAFAQIDTFERQLLAGLLGRSS
jgi:hypothetical protein